MSVECKISKSTECKTCDAMLVSNVITHYDETYDLNMLAIMVDRMAKNSRGKGIRLSKFERDLELFAFNFRRGQNK